MFFKIFILWNEIVLIKPFNKNVLTFLNNAKFLSFNVFSTKNPKKTDFYNLSIWKKPQCGCLQNVNHQYETFQKTKKNTRNYRTFQKPTRGDFQKKRNLNWKIFSSKFRFTFFSNTIYSTLPLAFFKHTL